LCAVCAAAPVLFWKRVFRKHICPVFPPLCAGEYEGKVKTKKSHRNAFYLYLFTYFFPSILCSKSIFQSLIEENAEARILLGGGLMFLEPFFIQKTLVRTKSCIKQTSLGESPNEPDY
jgi:hypothetical protein